MRLTETASRENINDAFWQACSGGQRRTAAYLLARGADPNWISSYANEPGIDAVVATDTRRNKFATWLREQISASDS